MTNSKDPHAVPAHVLAMLAAMEPSTEILPGDNPDKRPVEHSLSNVVQWLESDRTAPEPVVSCPVCYRELSIEGLSPLNGPIDAQTDADDPVALGLLCSHIMCSDCVATLCKAAETGALGCVLCRRNTVANLCGHLILTAVPQRGQRPGILGRGLDRVPRGGVGNWCRRCAEGADRRYLCQRRSAAIMSMWRWHVRRHRNGPQWTLTREE